jgi:chromosome partitioning protein
MGGILPRNHKPRGKSAVSKKIYGNDRFSARNIEAMFNLSVSKSALLGYEERKIIPKAKRAMRGKSAYRVWETSDLPAIGQALGYMTAPSETKVVSIFSLKGGTGKSTLTFQLARTLALHSIRTLVIGLDAQESVSQTLNRTMRASRKDDPNGLYQFLTRESKLEDCIVGTDLPTLHYIPETVVASGKYDVIIFDCNPAWTDLVTGALACSHILASPLGCDVNSLKASKIFINLLNDFRTDMRHEFERFFIVPTLAENNKLSQQILARYRLDYDEICTVTAIRRAIAVQEANVLGKSLMETAPTTPAYQDLIGVFREINSALTNDEFQVAGPQKAAYGLAPQHEAR